SERVAASNDGMSSGCGGLSVWQGVGRRTGLGPAKEGRRYVEDEIFYFSGQSVSGTGLGGDGESCGNGNHAGQRKILLSTGLSFRWGADPNEGRIGAGLLRDFRSAGR